MGSIAATMATTMANTAATAASNAAAASTEAAASYVGSDWLLYVDAAGGYDESEMVAPCLMLAQPGAALQVQARDGNVLRADALLHAPGASSSAQADGGAAFLYLDPLSAAGRAAARLCDGHAWRAWPLQEACGWSEAWFQSLLAGTAAAADVARWVDQARSALTSQQPRSDTMDWRMRQVADTLHDDVAGRLSVEHLAERVHWSPEHLRKVFRAMAGMTLSRYLMWCRLHRIVDCASAAHAVPVKRAPSAEATLLDAGFYDVPHGSRAVRRYFGLTARSALQPGISRADCRIDCRGA